MREETKGTAVRQSRAIGEARWAQQSTAAMKGQTSGVVRQAGRRANRQQIVAISAPQPQYCASTLLAAAAYGSGSSWQAHTHDSGVAFQ